MVNPDHTNIKFTTKADGISSDRSERRKAHAPNKDFRKILGKDKDRDHDEPKKKKKVDDSSYASASEKVENKAEKPEKKKSDVSLFDLASAKEEGKSIAKERPVEKITPVEEKTVSPSEMFGKLSSSKKTEEEPKMQFTQEQPDRSAINPVATGPSTIEVAPVEAKEKPAPISPQIQEIVDKLIDKLYTVSTEGRTDMTIVLKHPPLMKGANIVITEFESAKGEFNIKFENLSNAAKDLIDLHENQESLKLALAQKGYMVHIITTNTEMETRTVEEAEHLAQSEEKHEEQQRRQQQQDEEAKG